MGTSPVAPSNSRLDPEGDRKVSGLGVNPASLGLNKMERINIPTLTAMIVLIIWFGSRKPLVQALFLYHEPGFAVPQKGHFDSDVLMSFRQLGHRMDCL